MKISAQSVINALYNPDDIVCLRVFDDNGIFKALVGEDYLTVERKNKNPFSFQTYTRLLFSCNSIPKNYGDKSGLTAYSQRRFNAKIEASFNSVQRAKDSPGKRKTWRGLAMKDEE